MHHPKCAQRALPLVVFLFLVGILASAAPAFSEESVDLGNGRIVLVPPNLGVRAVDEVEPGIEPVWQEMLQHFAAQERPVTAIERTSGVALWNDVMAELQKREEETGQKPGVYDAYALFAQRVAEQVDYEKIVFPSLVTRVAKVRGSTASWDGVRQRIDMPSLDVPAIEGLVVAQRGVNGELAAASLHVAILQSDGQLFFEGTGGLALLQEIKPDTRDEIAATLRDDAFDDDRALREGVEVAFRKPLPASRAR
ncbi:MAG: hypothetical protein AAF430_08300 [Myxococcota bacterium]